MCNLHALTHFLAYPPWRVVELPATYQRRLRLPTGSVRLSCTLTAGVDGCHEAEGVRGAGCTRAWRGLPHVSVAPLVWHVSGGPPPPARPPAQRRGCAGRIMGAPTSRATSRGRRVRTSSFLAGATRLTSRGISKDWRRRGEFYERAREAKLGAGECQCSRAGTGAADRTREPRG